MSTASSFVDGAREISNRRMSGGARATSKASVHDDDDLQHAAATDDDSYSSDHTNNSTTTTASSGLSTPTGNGEGVVDEKPDQYHGGSPRARSRTRSPSSVSVTARAAGFRHSRKSPTPSIPGALTSSVPPAGNKNGFLELPAGAVGAPGTGWSGSWSRSPSPLGLIPIHRTFSSLIHKHEVPRKALHCSIGGIVIYLYRNGYQPTSIAPWLAAALVPVASADLLRLNWDSFNRLYIRVLGALMRESEVNGTNGVVWYIVGTLTVLAIFPKDVATLSILLLSWCDTAASTFGRAWGRYTPRIRRGKSLAGSLASFIVGAVTAWWFWGYIVPSTPAWPDDPVDGLMWSGRLGFLEGTGGGLVTGGLALGIASLWTGFVASASEVMDLFGLDDNVVIPVVSAVGIWGFLKVFG